MGDESPPLPRGTYNFNFDDFNENTNPFETKSKVNDLDNDLPIDPFKASKTLSLSPTTSNNNISDTVNSESGEIINHVEQPVKTRNKIPRSPIQSPDSSGEHECMEIQDSLQEHPEHLPESQPPVEESPKPQSQKKPALRKGIKKPKFKSKLKPPPNFGAHEGDVQIFAPPPGNNVADSPDSATNEDTPSKTEDNTSDELKANENTPNISHDNTADKVEQNEPDELDLKNKSLHHEPNDGVHELAPKNKSLFHGVGPEMAQSLEMVHDFGANEMPYVENEGISPAPEVFSDSVGLDIAGDAQINSVYLAGDSGVEQTSKTSGKDIVESKDENLRQDGNDSSLMTTPSNKSTSRVPKHPAARVLEGEVERKIPDKNGIRDRMDGTESIVQLVQDGPGQQVLKYSQSDWNKMKQELELDCQARLLNKEREWSKKLADKEKNISRLREDNKLLQQSNDDMRVIVTEFEKTISQLQTETEKTTNESQSSIEDIMKERDQALDDLQGVEMAFSDLHRRYEKTKGVVEGLKKNEEVLKKCIEDYQMKLKKSEEKLQTIKQQAEEKLDIANIEMDRLRKSTSSDMARLEAAMRKSDLQVASLQKSLDQKVKENEELTAICDELIAKVGTD